MRFAKMIVLPFLGRTQARPRRVCASRVSADGSGFRGPERIGGYGGLYATGTQGTGQLAFFKSAGSAWTRQSGHPQTGNPQSLHPQNGTGLEGRFHFRAVLNLTIRSK